MVAKEKPPEGLPSGWSVQHKVQRNGRRTECYINLDTGQTFYFKNDFVRYINAFSSHFNPQSDDGQLSKPPPLIDNQLADPQSNDAQLSKPSTEKLTQDEMKEGKFPEWLPKDWNFESKTVKSGSNIGKEYKCYYDPVTGHKCFSKAQVLQHLKSVNYGSCSKQIDSSIGGHTMENVALETNESPAWLPKGWIIEMKTHVIGPKIGKKFKYYVDPLKKRRFLSKPLVLQYLESANNKHNCFSSKQDDEGAAVHSTVKFQKGHSRPQEADDSSKQNARRHVNDLKRNVLSCRPNKTHVSVEKVVPDGLPPGWVLEIKIKGKRRDPYYTDPVCGYVFRSRKDVFRYLETGKISKHAFKPKNKRLNKSKRIQNKNPEVSTSALPNHDGATISRVTRASLSCRLLADKENFEVGNLAIPHSSRETSIRRVTRASTNTGLVAAPITESLRGNLPLIDSTDSKASSEREHYTLPKSGSASVRRITRGSHKSKLASAPTTENLQTIKLKRNRGERVELKEKAIEKSTKAKGKIYPAKGS